MSMLVQTLAALMVRLAERAPTVALLGALGVWAVVSLAVVFLVHGEPDDRRAIQAAESAARAQWAEVYWERRQARALEAACDPAWVDQ